MLFIYQKKTRLILMYVKDKYMNLNVELTKEYLNNNIKGNIYNIGL